MYTDEMFRYFARKKVFDMLREIAAVEGVPLLPSIGVGDVDLGAEEVEMKGRLKDLYDIFFSG